MFSTFKPVRPRIDQPFLRSLEVILHVTLAADEGAHLLPRGVAIHVVVLHALAGFDARMPSINPGRVTRSCSVVGSWQSMHATGCVTSLRASANGI